MRCLFVQIRCHPGKSYQVADKLFEREIASELYSTSGEWDLLMKVYVPNEDDIGRFINDNVLDIEGIAQSLTTTTYHAF